MPRIYNWYCPRLSCRAIITKTGKPFLTEDSYKCKRCNEVFSAERLLRENMKILRRQLDKELENSQ